MEGCGCLRYSSDVPEVEPSLGGLWASSVELAFSALRGTVWFGACFHFTTKMSGFFSLSL